MIDASNRTAVAPQAAPHAAARAVESRKSAVEGARGRRLGSALGLSTLDSRLPTLVATAVLLAGATSACRGQPSSDPPFHLVPDMDHQGKFKAQSANPFFADGKAMRNFVEGTLAVGQLHEDEAPYTGKDEGGAWLTRPPMPVDELVLARGQQRFDIYCSPCHDKTGSGQGLVIKHGYPLPVNLASEHTRGLKDGEVYDIITHGVRNMPSYAAQIPVADRWAIVTWVRVLQKSQAAKSTDVPPGTPIEPESATP